MSERIRNCRVLLFAYSLFSFLFRSPFFPHPFPSFLFFFFFASLSFFALLPTCKVLVTNKDVEWGYSFNPRISYVDDREMGYLSGA